MITRVVWAKAWADGQGVTYDKDSPSRGAAMTHSAILEAAARALCGVTGLPQARWHTRIEEAEAIIAAVTPLILANERKEIAEQARRYAGHYQEGSDGRNTFIMLAEWIEARK